MPANQEELDRITQEVLSGIGEPAPTAPRRLPGVEEADPSPDPAQYWAVETELDQVTQDILRGLGTAAPKAAIPPGYDEPPKPMVPQEVRRGSRSKISDLDDQEALRYLPKTLSETPPPELLEDVDWESDPEGFSRAHRKMVREYGRARTTEDKAEIMRGFTEEWNPDILKRSEEKTGVFMKTLTGLAHVVEWVDSWSGRPIRSLTKSLWGSRKRGLEGGGEYNLEEMHRAISENYKNSDGSFDDGEETLKNAVKYLSVVGGQPLAWAHQEASGQDFTEANWVGSVDEGIDKMFDFGADAIQWATWTGMGVLDQALPFVGDNYKGWAEAREKHIEEGSSFGHGALGFVGLVVSDPLSFLKLPRAFDLAGAKVTESADHLIKDVASYKIAARAKELRKSGKYADEAGEIDEARILQDAEEAVVSDVNYSVIDAANASYIKGGDVHGWGPIELLKQWRATVESTDPAYWKAKFPDRSDEWAKEAAGEFVMDKPNMAAIESIGKHLNVTFKTNATPTDRIEEVWSALNKESNRQKRLYDIEVKLTGEVDPETGVEAIKTFIHWIDPREALDVNGNMTFRLNRGVTTAKPDLATKLGRAAGKALTKRPPKTAAAAEAAEEAARAAAYKQTKVFAKGDNRRVRWGFAAMKHANIGGLDRSRMVLESIVGLEKAQPYFSKVAGEWQPVQPMHAAMWRRVERGELRDQAERTLDRQRLANHIAKIEGIVDTTTPEGNDVLKLAMAYKELGKHIPATEANIELAAWFSKTQKLLDNVEKGITDDLPPEVAKLLEESIGAIEQADEFEFLGRALRKAYEKIGPERREALKTFKAQLTDASWLLKKILVDDFRVKAEMEAVVELSSNIDKLKILRKARADLDKMATKENFSEAGSLDALLRQLRQIKKIQDEGIDAIREGVPEMARTEAEFLQRMRTRGLIPEGTNRSWAKTKDSVREGVERRLGGTGVSEYAEQADGVMATLTARAEAWASWNDLPADHADAWFAKNLGDIEGELGIGEVKATEASGLSSRPVGVFSETAQDAAGNPIEATREELERILKAHAEDAPGLAQTLRTFALDGDYRAIADKITPHLSSVKIRVLNSGGYGPFSVAGGGARGATISRQGEPVEVWLRGADLTGTGINAETVLHELVHAATMNRVADGRLAANSNTALGRTTRELHKLVGTVGRAMDEMKFQEDALSRRPGPPRHDFNIDELVAYGLTNREFQIVLQQIKIDNKSGFTRFVELIADLLGIKGREVTALTEVIRLTDDLLEATTTGLPEKRWTWDLPLDDIVEEADQIKAAFQSQTFQGMIKGAGRVFAKDLPVKDYEIASDWIRRELGDAGFRKGGEWSEAGMSAWGQAFANWTKSGRVSNHGLREVFAKFKDWIFKMYRAVSGQKEFKFKISPEVEEIFDRLLTKDSHYATHPMVREFDVAYRNYMTSYGGNISVLGKAVLNEVLSSMMEAAKYSPAKVRWVHDKLFSKDKMESVEAWKFINEEVSERLSGRFNPPRGKFQIKAPEFKNNKAQFKAAISGALQENAGLTAEEAADMVRLAEFDDIVTSAIPAGRFTYNQGRNNFQEIVLAFAKRFVALNPDKAPVYPRMVYKVPGRAAIDAKNNLREAQAAWKQRRPRVDVDDELRFDYEKLRIDYYKAASQVLKMAGRPDADTLARKILSQDLTPSDKIGEEVLGRAVEVAPVSPAAIELKKALDEAVERLSIPVDKRRADVEGRIKSYEIAIKDTEGKIKAAEDELAGLKAGKKPVVEGAAEAVPPKQGPGIEKLPSKLKRKSPGRYATEDGRFVVERVDGSWEWYVLDKKGGEVVDDALMESGGFGTKKAAEDDLKQHLSNYGKNIHPEGGTWSERARLAEDAAAEPKPVDIPDDISRQASAYQSARNVDPHDDLIGEVLSLQQGKPAVVVHRLKKIVEDKLKRDHGISERSAKRLIKDEGSDWSARTKGERASSVVRNAFEDPAGWVRERVEELRRSARPDDYRFNVKAVESFLEGQGGVLPDVARAAVKARVAIDEATETLQRLQESRAALIEELKAMDITPDEASLAEAAEVSAKRAPVSEEAMENARAQLKWLETEIAKEEALIYGVRKDARVKADAMSKAAFEEELAPLAKYEVGEGGRRKRVLTGRGEDEITGSVERIQRKIAEGLTKGQPGKMKDAADLPSVVPKQLTKSMKKRIEALPGAQEEMLDIARKLKWDTTDPGEIWERIVNYNKKAKSYGDLAEEKRNAAMAAVRDSDRLRAFDAMPETEKTVVYNIVKDPRKYSVPPGASKKVRGMAESLGMTSRGKNDIFIHLHGEHITRRYGPDVRVKKVKVGDHFTDEEMEQALAVATLMDDFLEDKLKKLQNHGRLAKYRDKKIGAKIDLIGRKINGKEDLSPGETKDSLLKQRDELRKEEFRPWTKEEFLRRVNVASYIPHMMRIATQRKIDGLKGRFLPANYKISFERMRTRASILDDLNEQARDELAEDMLYHDVTSLMSNGPEFQSVFHEYDEVGNMIGGKSPEELSAIYDAAQSLQLREHFSPDEWSALINKKRTQADLDSVYEFFEADYFTLIKRYSESVDRSIADQVFIEDILEMFPMGKEMGMDSRFIDNPDLAREFGYVRLNKRDHIEAIGRMSLPDELTPNIENWVNQQLVDGASVPEVMAGLRRKGVNVSRNYIELHRSMPDVFVPEPVAEYLKWLRTPEQHKGAWGALVNLADGFHALAKTMATVSSLAHVGMNYTGNYASVAQKIGVDLFNPRHHYNMWLMMGSDAFPQLESKVITIGAHKKTIGELKRQFGSYGIDESPRTQAFLEEALGKGDVSAAKAPLGTMLLGSGLGATGGWIAGSAVAGPLGGAAGGVLGSWVGALGGEVLGKSWKTAIDPKTKKLAVGPMSKRELDVGRGARAVYKTEIGKFVEAIESAKKGRLKDLVQATGERVVGAGAGAAIATALGGPGVAAVAAAIGKASFPSYIKMMSALNQNVEIQARRLLGLAELSRGKTLDDVAFGVQDTMRNYSHLTPFERNILRRLFFFYTWDAGNVRFQLRQMVKNPRQAGIFNQFMNGVYNGQFTESEIQSLPEYLRWKAIVRTGGAKIFSVSGLPQQAAIELSRGFGTHGGKPIGLFARGRPDVLLLLELMLGNQSLYYGKGWEKLDNVRQMKNAPPMLKWFVGFPSKPVEVPVYKKGRVVGTRLDYRSNNPERYYMVSRLPGWRVMNEYMKLVQDTFIARALDAGDPSARATTEERMLAFSIGLKPYYVDFESQREAMAWMLDEALKTEWDRVNKNFVRKQSYLNRTLDYGRGKLLYPGEPVDSEQGD